MSCRARTRRWAVIAVPAVVMLLVACDRFEAYKLEATSADGKELLREFGEVSRRRGMICEDAAHKRLESITSLVLPTVVLCRDWKTHVDIRAEFGEQSVTLDIKAVSGGLLGTPPGKKVVEELQQAFRDAANGSVRVTTISP
jgi:hypothetical protein